MAEATKNEFSLVNVGAIHNFKFVAPPGKLTVLMGPNGSGKSTALAALSRLEGRSKSDAPLTFRDGANGGLVSGPGVNLRLTPSGNSRKTGELACEPVDVDLTIADIWDPGLKDPEAADRKRIEAVCTVLELSPDVKVFESCFADAGVELSEIATKKALTAETVVGMANQLKRDSDAVALELEKQAKTLGIEIDTARESFKDIDLDAESDAAFLDAAVEEATNTLSALQERAKAAAEGRVRLDEIPSFSIDKAQMELTEATKALEDCQQRKAATEEVVEKLKEQLSKAQSDLNCARNAIEMANQKLEHAQQKVDLAKAAVGIRELISKSPSEEEISRAEFAVATAKEARDNGVLVRQAKKSLATIEAKDMEQEALQKKAATVRMAGKACQAKLATLLDGTGLSVGKEGDFEGRLVVGHEARGECLFGDLSDGERWTKAIGIAVESVRRRGVKHGLLLLPQTCWEGLDETNRSAIVEAVSGTDLAIITAQASGKKSEPLKTVILRSI